jgi:hypothetical protein
VDPAQIAGVWNGKRSSEAVGGCGNDGSKKKVRLTVDRKTDGSLTVTEAWAPDYVNQGFPWQGHVADNGVGQAIRSASATCNGEKREYKIRLAGKLSTDKGGLRLRLEGEDGPCPQYYCYFKLKYTLSRDQ